MSVGSEVSALSLENPPLPSGTQPLRNQVGGHTFGKGKTKLGMLEKDGMVLKPLQSPPRGERELNFYKEMFASEQGWAKDLRPMLAAYKGEWRTEQHPGVKYIALENITKKFRFPCVLDVKIGARTHDPLASPDKIEREIAKCSWKAKTGFSLIGLKTYDPESSEWTSVNSRYLRHIEESDIVTQGLNVFFNRNHPNFRAGIVKTFIEKVERIQRWFTDQRRFAFFSSSILFVYDAAILLNSADNSADCSQFADARMIDFAHVFPSTEQDDNYITGLQGVVQYFQQVLDQ